MATAPSTPPAPRDGGLPGTRFECSVEFLHDGQITTTPAEDDPALPDPMTLRIFFSPDREFALFRLQAMIPLQPESGVEGVTSLQFHLQFRPERMHSLRLDDSSLHFQFTGPDAISLIGPASIPVGGLRPTTSALRAMALLSRQLGLVIHLSPARALQYAQSLTALCKAISTADTHLRADPMQAGTEKLYRGTGGRFVAPAEILGDSVGDVPPLYNDVALSAPISPGPSTRKTKRLRTASPSQSESDTPALKQLTGPHRAQVLAELLCQLDDREKSIRVLIEELDTRSARAANQMQQMDEQAQRLTELTAAATTAAVSSVGKISAKTSSNPCPTQVPRSSPSPSAASSTASKISTRIQAYIEAQLDMVREEMRAHNEEYVDNTVADHATTEEMQTYVENSLSDYATVEAMESLVNDELDGALSNHVEDFQMYEAITEAVDTAIEGIRDRVMAAWDH